LQKKAWNVQKAGKKGGLKLTPTRSSRGLRKSVAYREASREDLEDSEREEEEDSGTEDCIIVAI